MARMTPWREWIGAPRGAALAALVVSAAAMTAATFAAPLRPGVRYWRGNDGTQVEREARLSEDHYRDAWRGVRRIQLRDSLNALARPGVSVRIDPQMDAATKSRFERRTRLAWAAFEIDAPRVPVVLAGIAAKAKEPFTVPSFTALPVSVNEPCLVVISNRDVWATSDGEAQAAQNARLMRDFMIGCALFARHGLPGAAVGAELRRIGWAPVPLRFSRSGMFWWRGESTLEVAAHTEPRFLPYIACAAGRVSACAEGADVGVSRTREKPAYMSSAFGYFESYVLGRSLLALLQASLPPAEFERLWHDERPFDVALSAISGRRLDDWVHQAVLRGTRPYVSSFSPVSPIVVRALFFFVLAAVIGVALQTRRTITDAA
ncbi:MAG: hypothetical protein AABZ29_09515 [Gemmatimonadota bacterium]